MHIIEQTHITSSAYEDPRETAAEAIAELEREYAAGEIETPAYLIKKRSFVRML